MKYGDSMIIKGLNNSYEGKTVEILERDNLSELKNNWIVSCEDVRLSVNEDYLVGIDAEELAIMQARKDFKYLEHNLDLYLYDEDSIGDIVRDLVEGKKKLLDLMIWSIEDIIYYTDNNGISEDKEFLKYDEEALNIKERYNLY